MARTRRGPMPGVYPTDSGDAELLADANRDGGWMLSVDGVPQSYVDLDDPTYLDFEYMQLVAEVVDRLGDRADAAIDAVHVGGGACTLARYIAATRPGSRQLVLEPDAGLLRVVREQLALKSVRGLKVRVTDGASGLSALPDDADDLVVLDAFTGAQMPPELATVEFAEQAARVLRPHGVYVINISDGGRLVFARHLVATVRAVFGHALMLAEPGILRGRRHGNLVVAASRTPMDDATLATLTRRAASGLTQARCVHGHDLDRFRAGAAPLRQGDEIPISPPPRSLWDPPRG